MRAFWAVGEALQIRQIAQMVIGEVIDSGEALEGVKGFKDRFWSDLTVFYSFKDQIPGFLNAFLIFLAVKLSFYAALKID